MAWSIELASTKLATSWTDLTPKVDRTTISFGGQAHLGESGSGFGFNYDDDDASRFVRPRRAVRCTIGGVVVARGRIFNADLGRGTMPVDDARQFNVEIGDANAHLRGIAIHGWSRPEETDVARVTALCAAVLAGNRRASTNLATTYLAAGNTVTLPAERYESTNPLEILESIAKVAGKEFFVTADDELFYDLPTSTAYAAGITVTDDAPDLVTEFAPMDPRGAQDSTEWLSGIKLVYGDDNANIVVEDTAAEDFGDHWNEVVQGESKDATTASAEATALLSERAAVEERYTFSLLLDEADIGLLKYGQTFSYRAAASGVTTPTTVRASRIEYQWAGDEKWLLNVEASFPVKSGQRLRPGNKRPPGPFVPGDATILAHAQNGPDGTFTDWNMPSISPTGDNVLLVGFIADNPQTVGLSSTGWDLVAHLHTEGTRHWLFHRYHATGAAPYADTFNGSGDPATFHAVQLALRAGSAPGDINWGTNSADYNNPPGFPTDPTIQAVFNDSATASGGSVLVAYVSLTTDTGAIFTDFNWPDGWKVLETVPGHPDVGRAEVAYKIAEGGETGVTVEVQSTLVSSLVLIVAEYEGANLQSVPSYGQPTAGEELTGDGTTTLFTTNYPYLPGSLRVTVNGQLWPVTETDPDAGTFTFATAPASGAVIVAYYQGTGLDGTGEENPPATTEPGTLGVTDLDAHLTDPTDAHDASAVSVADAGGYFTGTDVEAVLQELGATTGAGSGHVLNVLDYGAVADDIAGAGTDSTAAIQAAIDAAEANHVAGEGPTTVYFPGYFRVTATLTVQRGITLQGDGGESGGSRIRMSTANTTLFSLNDPGIATFRAIYLLGPDGNTSGDGIVATKDAYTDDVRIEKFYNGLHLGNGSFYSRHNRLMAYDNTFAGVLLDSGCNNATFIGGRYQNNAYGFRFSSVHGFRLVGGSVEANSYGIWSDGGSQALYIGGTYFENNNTNDILIGQGSADNAVSIVGCLFTTTGTIRSIDVGNHATPRVTIDSCYFDAGNPPTSGDIRTQHASTDVVLINNVYSGAGISIAGDAWELDPSSSITPSNHGTAAAGSSRHPARADHIHNADSGTPATTVEAETTFGIASAVGTDTEYARQDHTHGTPANPVTGPALSALGVVGPILIADDHSTPIVFGDILLTEEGDDILYADIGA